MSGTLEIWEGDAMKKMLCTRMQAGICPGFFLLLLLLLLFLSRCFYPPLDRMLPTRGCARRKKRHMYKTGLNLSAKSPYHHARL
ncbi:hypothetical protein DL89DRAFT_40112 [Linderina pennispora]|uniref:Uncharacterized protein n=1 Tax=Linderina pennispora TaxID=61395 RepID=A0A1Y1W3B7_9FUNG|nr:uncharacterized protein DL89DRAFT_40112 [Linderina pennispora]ORX68021.1 hypothetical protein DL89DRAFT_40112 [Linderina pennispora]